jgi:hypothetical protein
VTRLLAVLATLLLLGACNGGTGDDESSASEEKALLETRDRVGAELRSVVTEVASGLGGTLRFSQGNYESCSSDLDGPTAFRYDINGRIDVPRTVASGDAATLTAVLEEAGWVVKTSGPDLVASKDDIDLSVGVREGRDFLLFHGGPDRCFEVGRERADRFLAKEPDPLGDPTG